MGLWCLRCEQRRIREHGRFNGVEGLNRAVTTFNGKELCMGCVDELLAAIEPCAHDSCNGTGNPDEWECMACGAILRSESYVREDGVRLHRFVPVEPKPKVRPTEIDDGMDWQAEHDPLSGNPLGEQDEIAGRIT